MRILRLAVVAWLLVGGPVPDLLAAQPEVRDEARFFSADAVREANRSIAEIRRQTGKDLLIETLAGPPAGVAERLTREPRDRVYADWARRRASDAAVNGIYVVITRKPAHLQIAVGDQTSRGAFTVADRDRLRDLLLEAFRQRRYDEGLRDAVAFTGRTLAARVGPRAAVPPARVPAPAPEPASGGLGGFSWTSILLWGVLIVGGLWLLARVLQSRAEARRLGGGEAAPGTPGSGPVQGPGYGAGYPGSGGGGGFGRGLLGGLLGGMAGGYLYDRLRDRGHADAGGFTPGSEPATADTDFSSSGGDFGDSGSGGGDFGDGGGAAGGGGDFGGGAGDSDA